MAKAKHPVCLLILDGFGINERKEGNAVHLARKPHLDAIFAKYPNNRLLASGEAVGLMEGQMGDSNVGHLNIAGALCTKMGPDQQGCAGRRVPEKWMAEKGHD